MKVGERRPGQLRMPVIGQEFAFVEIDDAVDVPCEIDLPSAARVRILPDVVEVADGQRDASLPALGVQRRRPVGRGNVNGVWLYRRTMAGAE